MKVILDGRKMVDKETTHEYLKKELQFPDYYGCNLDALYDCLTETEKVLEIQIEYQEDLYENLGEYAEALIETMQDAGIEITIVK